jgi:hypothetical protein
MTSGLTIGSEYKHQEIDFLSKKVVSETTMQYLGRHPYDNRHMFAMKPAGAVYCPEPSEFLSELLPI